MLTAMGFIYFNQQHCDMVVLEVGLGGRHDSTNVVDPLLSVITSIGLDHLNVLGSNVREIAEQKAGIIKPNKPVVVGWDS
jgi:dihydrofolate synthase/folylpolyglutamate synthase